MLVGRRASGFVLVAKGLPDDRAPLIRPSGGRSWWAHFEFTRINIGPTTLRKTIEAVRVLRALSSIGDARPSRIEDYDGCECKRTHVP